MPETIRELLDLMEIHKDIVRAQEQVRHMRAEVDQLRAELRRILDRLDHKPPPKRFDFSAFVETVWFRIIIKIGLIGALLALNVKLIDIIPMVLT